MKGLEALEYLDDIAHGRKMKYDPHELKLLVEKDLKVLEILKSKVKFEVNNKNIFGFKQNNLVVNKDIFTPVYLTQEEYDLLKEVLK